MRSLYLNPSMRLLRMDAGTEITFKVTDICASCAPHQLRVEPYHKSTYFSAPGRPLLWVFTKCWGHPMHPKFYTESLKPGTALNKHNNPPLRSCWNWVKAAYAAQAAANAKNDPWQASVPFVTDPAVLCRYSAFPQVPSVLPVA